jgi:acetyl esterase/lipase
VQGFRSGQASWFLDALRENEAVKWAPRAPLRLYYGASDVDVHPDDAVLGAQKLREHGGNVEVVAVGDFDHASVVFHAVPMVQEWFAQVADG